MKYLFYILIPILLVGCTPREKSLYSPQVEQRFEQLGTDDDFFITTYVWYNTEIVYSSYTYNISIDSLYVIKARQLSVAEDYKIKLVKALD